MGKSAPTLAEVTDYPLGADHRHIPVSSWRIPMSGTRSIIVEDNFFKAGLSNFIEKSVELYQWRYHTRTSNPAHNKFFGSTLWSNGSSEDNFFYKIWKLIHKDVACVTDCYCFRIMANGQVKGQNGNWHTDAGDRTVLYFPMQWAAEWGGSTHFKINDSETEIQYKQNQLIIFDSHILHYGSGPAINNILRVSIAFNLRIKTTGPTEAEPDFEDESKPKL